MHRILFRRWPAELSALVLLAASCQTQAANAAVLTQRQNLYFKEIVMGRCYAHPPNMDPKEGGAPLCPFVVDSLAVVLDSQLDNDIEASSYFMYLGMTTYDSAKDSALFLWPPPTTHEDTYKMLVNLDATLPETTPGGSLLHGLVFCGTDRRMDCPVEFWKNSNGGLLAFWQGVYSNFAATIQGRVRILVLEDDIAEIPSLWKDHVLPQLKAATISSVEILAINCQAPGVLDLLMFIQSKRNINSQCTAIKRQSGGNIHDGWCDIADQLDDMNAGSDEKSRNWSTVVPSTASSDVLDCRQCPAAGEENVYEYLFWALIVLGVATAYAFWSVRHYLPEYQRIPDATAVQHELQRQNHNGLPKQ